ncbi:MAG TPA: transcription termination/antitermination protein NusG [Acidimicrobiales bacterium]|jgi:transcriptional antiterminator NusG|nr:transcription termination/antitermination protein NusG [Acidimicrobiales bacterium]
MTDAPEHGGTTPEDTTGHVAFVEAVSTSTELVDAEGVPVGEVEESIEVIETVDADGTEHAVAIDQVDVLDRDGTVVDEVVDVVELDDDQAEDADLLDEDDEDDEEERPESPFDRPGRWYVVHTYSGYENKVKGNLENIIKARELADRIHEIVVPMEDVVEFKNGKKVTVSKKVFPGYLLVRCTPSDDVWFAIRSSPGVTGFVGSASKPTPLSRREVESILHVKAEGVEAPTKRTRPAHEFELNETVRIKEGPFADFPGHIAEINEDQLKVKVLVDIFGRETPVELEFSQVAKL